MPALLALGAVAGLAVVLHSRIVHHYSGKEAADDEAALGLSADSAVAEGGDVVAKFPSYSRFKQVASQPVAFKGVTFKGKGEEFEEIIFPEEDGVSTKAKGARHRDLEEDSICVGFDVNPEYPEPYPNGKWPQEYIIEGAFPEGFVWGMGTAAYQIEGAYREGGRGASIWDTFTGADTVGMPGAACSYCCKKAPCQPHHLMAAPGATGNVACDHYHRWKEDVALMRSMGLRHYRFSISWPRLFPAGESKGEANPEGVTFYNNLIDELLASGITPYVTLYHWDLPQALLDPPRVNGWWSRDKNGKPNGEILDAWLHYAESCFALFGDRVKTWITFNEAWTFTFLASGYGKAPSLPEFNDMAKDPWIAGHNVLNAHAAAVALYRAKFYTIQKGQIGITNNQDWREPKTSDSADVCAAEHAVEFQMGWFTDPIFGGAGDYPPAMRQRFGDQLPEFTPEQKRLINGSADFLGVNHYGTGFASFDADSAGVDLSHARMTEGPLFAKGQSSWLYGAGWGFRKLLNWVSKRYKGVPIYVTESGWSLAAKTVEEGVDDRQRLEYYANYTSEMSRAIYEDGVDIRGYFAWSLMDNFEWEMGYDERFGTTFVDFAPAVDRHGPAGSKAPQPSEGHQSRQRKLSSCWLEAVWRSNRLVDPDSENFGGCVVEVVFSGTYVERSAGQPGHVVTVTVGPSMGAATISGTDAANVSWGPVPAKVTAGTIVADFSSLGQSASLAGYWNSEDHSIHWGDGRVWEQYTPPPPVAPITAQDTKKEKSGAAPLATALSSLAAILLSTAAGVA